MAFAVRLCLTKSDQEQVRAITEDDIGIKVLYEHPSGAQDADPASFVEYSSKTIPEQPVRPTLTASSIVAIHGIGAHPDDTWCKKLDAGGYVNWLSDLNMLPKVVPQTRIMRYGYESQWFGDETIQLKTSTVAQRLLQSLQRERKKCPLRPLIFIAHCFGGLVVLKATVDAKRLNSRWAGIYTSTTGLLFFGTPFRGAGGLSQAEMLQAIQSQYEDDQIQASTLNILAPGNKTLGDLLDLFFETRQERNLARVACFFEQKPSNVGAILGGPRMNKFVVDESSGCLDQSESTEKFSLSRDHFSMNKFGKPAEEDYKMVCEVIETMVEQAPALMAARNQQCNDFRVKFNLTGLPVTGHFVDRNTEMEEIEGNLLPSNIQNRRKTHVLYGLGGIGKTQLAIAYARKHQESYSAILWLNGNSKETLLQSFASFSRHASISAAQHAKVIDAEAKAVLEWLALRGNRRWLMIVDNVDRKYTLDAEDPQAYDMQSFLPGADHGSILITTRLISLGEIGHSTNMKELDLEQALELLSNRSGLPQVAKDMNKLVKRLGYLPLALVQAGKYMRETSTKCSKYLELYESSWCELVEQVPQIQDYENGSIQTTWMISYKRVEKNDPSAARFLQLCAYLDHEDIWYELFSCGSRGVKECDWLQDLAQSEISFKRVIQNLLAYSLIESRRDVESYSIHPVVHDWCTERISDGKLDLIMLAPTIVSSAVPGTSEPEYWLLGQRLIPHADRCIQQLYKSGLSFAMEYLGATGPFYNLGNLYAHQGKMKEAEDMYLRALTGKEKAWGPEHTSTLDTVNNLGNVYRKQGKMKEAEDMILRALTGFEKGWGPEHTSTLSAVGNLGNLYTDQGKMEEAEDMYLRALTGYEKAWGPDHTSTLDTVNNLGNLHVNQGRMKEAEDMYLRALAGKEKAWGSEHTSTLDTVNNLGILYRKQGKMKEAEAMYLRALTGKEKAWGPEHQQTLDTRFNLGLMYKAMSMSSDAEQHLELVVQGYTKTLGPEHQETVEALDLLKFVRSARREESGIVGPAEAA